MKAEKTCSRGHFIRLANAKKFKLEKQMLDMVNTRQCTQWLILFEMAEIPEGLNSCGDMYL